MSILSGKMLKRSEWWSLPGERQPTRRRCRSPRLRRLRALFWACWQGQELAALASSAKRFYYYSDLIALLSPNYVCVLRPVHWQLSDLPCFRVRRATIKAHPTTPRHPRPYGRGSSPGRTKTPDIFLSCVKHTAGLLALHWKHMRNFSFQRGQNA